MRAKRPDAERPFVCPGYPVVPALFVLVAVVMTGMSVYGDREAKFVHTLPWLGVLAAGVPVFYVWRRLTGTVSRV
jgi:APA family basic amino acid/polyamine antiporter